LQRGKPVVQGALTDIKTSFGKKNLTILGDMSFEFLQSMPGVVKYAEIVGGCRLQIETEDISQKIFESLQGKGFIRKFDLEEPTLKDIFINKVSTSYEKVLDSFITYIFITIQNKIIYHYYFTYNWNYLFNWKFTTNY